MALDVADTLVLQSGRPVGVISTGEQAPLVVSALGPQLPGVRRNPTAGTAAGWVQTLQALELLLASDLIAQRKPDALAGVSDTGQLLAGVLSQLPPGATTDLVVERLRATWSRPAW